MNATDGAEERDDSERLITDKLNEQVGRIPKKPSQAKERMSPENIQHYTIPKKIEETG